MSKKMDAVVEHIKSLEAGEKVSVRSLAELLSVSEGTAYKAIKQAQALDLVQTKPKAGTIRIPDRKTTLEHSISLDAAIRRLGLSVLAGELRDTQINSIVIGDGSMAQFRQSIRQAENAVLCLVGDRPDLQREAIASGALLLMTSGTPINQALEFAAIQHHSCVLGAQQDSYTVLHLLHTLQGPEATDASLDPTRNWMRTPQYLYYNDIVSDWHRVYSDIFSLNARYAIVDDDLKICGSLDASNVLSAAPTEKLYNLYDWQTMCCVIDKDTPMEVLAEKMIAQNTELAFVEQAGELCGLITANDVLRYYRYGLSRQGQDVSMLELADHNLSHTRCVYLAHLHGCKGRKDQAPTGRLSPLLLEAAAQHAGALLGEGCLMDSGTFYTPSPLLDPGEIMISSEVMKQSQESCSLEVEMYDDSACYVRCTLTFSAGAQAPQ